MQETQVLSLGQEPLEKEMATHFSILAWEILWTEETGWLQSMGSQGSDMNHHHIFIQSSVKGHRLFSCLGYCE